MICPNCQTPVPDGSSFCDNCGSPLPAPTQPMAQQPQPDAYGQQQAPMPQQPYQQPPQQPAYGQPYPAYPQQPSKSAGGKIILIVIIVIAVLVIGGLVIRPIISDMLNPNEPGKEQPDPEIRTNTNNANVENNTVTENENANTSNEANEIPVVPAEPAKPQVISRYSTSAMAEVGDAYWMTDPMIVYGTMPDGVEKLDLDQVGGGWKFMIVSRGEDRYEYFANCLVEIPSVDNAVATVTWDKVRINGEIHDAGTPTSVFEGPLSGDMIGSGMLTFDGFWERDGHQYGIGTFMWPDGEKATVAMVRP